jgi:hypothetical protein
MKSIITQFPVAGKHFPSAGCATAANLVRRDADIFSKQIKTLKHIFTLVQFFHSRYSFNDLTYT